MRRKLQRGISLLQIMGIVIVVGVILTVLAHHLVK